MEKIINNTIKETVYKKVLPSGTTIIFIPKENTNKKYIICGIKFGANDRRFINKEGKEIVLPDGVAHYLEHKMFEQENGINSLDALSSLGVDANAYTTNDHTAYLFECTKNFDKALKELLDYVQHPFFTDENVEKEKGIISQEIQMYDDEPEWKLYLNTMKAMYHNNPVKIDVAGTVQSIKRINKEVLYETYNNFYLPENMTIVVCGNFEKDYIFDLIEKNLIQKSKMKAKRIFDDEPNTICKKEIIENKDVSIPLFSFGYKLDEKSINAKRIIETEILLEIIIGTSSKLFEKLYENGILYEEVSSHIEFAKNNYSHILIQGKSNRIEELEVLLKNEIERFKDNGINKEDFERAKRKLYGLYVREFDDVQDVSNLFLSNYIKDIDAFEYIDSFSKISLEEINNTLLEFFDEDKKVKAIIKKGE